MVQYIPGLLKLGPSPERGGIVISDSQVVRSHDTHNIMPSSRLTQESYASVVGVMNISSDPPAARGIENIPLFLPPRFREGGAAGGGFCTAGAFHQSLLLCMMFTWVTAAAATTTPTPQPSSGVS